MISPISVGHLRVAVGEEQGGGAGHDVGQPEAAGRPRCPRSARSARRRRPEGGPHAGVAGAQPVVVDDRHAQPADVELVDRHARTGAPARAASSGRARRCRRPRRGSGPRRPPSGPAARSGSCRRGRGRRGRGGCVRASPSRRPRPTSRPAAGSTRPCPSRWRAGRGRRPAPRRTRRSTRPACARGAHGLRVGPWRIEVVYGRWPISGDAVRPTGTAPAASSRADIVLVTVPIAVPERGAGPGVRPALDGSSSLMASGTPASGPGSSPAATRASTASATARARSGSRNTNASSAGRCARCGRGTPPARRGPAERPGAHVVGDGPGGAAGAARPRS